jgi:hypothetical protein
MDSVDSLLIEKNLEGTNQMKNQEHLFHLELAKVEEKTHLTNEPLQILVKVH